jgi:hypothetical protein
MTLLLFRLIRDFVPDLQPGLIEYAHYDGMTPDEFKRLQKNGYAIISVVKGEDWADAIWQSKPLARLTGLSICEHNNVHERMAMFADEKRAKKYRDDLRRVINGEVFTSVELMLFKDKLHAIELYRWCVNQDQRYLYTVARDVTAQYRLTQSSD